MASRQKEHTLIAALKATGTGDWYLRPAYEFLGENPDATDQQVAEALTKACTATPQGSVFNVTAAKARELCRGKKVSDFEGKPPPNKENLAHQHLREELNKGIEALGDKLAGALGELRKPETAGKR